ncbi:MAG: phage major capsid protein [Bacteroidales bacterium]|nr:phage major capsid protein [Bacteroidales bacterium]
MNKKMRELQAAIMAKHEEAKGYMEGETKDLDRAQSALDAAEELQKEYDIEAKLFEAEKSKAAAQPPAEPQKADGFKAMAKLLNRKPLNDAEKALITGTGSTAGENNLVPEDVKAEINELRKSYVSAKNLVTVVTTDALAGTVNYEKGAPAGLTEFDDGDAIEEGTPSFEPKKFAIKFFGKLIPVSRILLGAEKAGLMNYLDRWFVKNAVISENAKIFATLKAGYNAGAPKAVAGWKALKKSIAVDLDPACLTDGIIITNQSGFAALDAEEDKDGKPVLQPNPANPTQKLFQGLPVHVFADTQLANIDATHFPMIYGSVKAGCTFVEHMALEFAASEHANFNKNQNTLRVIEGFDVMSTDVSAYVYGSFSATA